MVVKELLNVVLIWRKYGWVHPWFLPGGALFRGLIIDQTIEIVDPNQPNSGWGSWDEGMNSSLQHLSVPIVWQTEIEFDDHPVFQCLSHQRWQQVPMWQPRSIRFELQFAPYEFFSILGEQSTSNKGGG